MNPHALLPHAPTLATSADWRTYYRANAAVQLPIPWERGAELTDAERDAIASTLLTANHIGGHLEAERRHVLGFLLLVFALSIPFWILGGLFEIQLLPGLPIGALAAFAPAIAAALIVYRDRQLSSIQSLLVYPKLSILK